VIVVWTVAFMALIPGLALAGSTGSARPARPAPTADAPPPGLRLTISATTERIPLARTREPIQLSLDALGRKIRLKTSKKDNPKALAARIATHVGMLCPRVEVKDGVVELGCRSRRIEAQLTHQGKEWYLDINELRGLPWRAGEDAPPSYHYDPWRIGLGQSCPGKNAITQGECELKAGQVLEAAGHFRKALDTTGRQMACVRLGDLAVGIGDPITAMGWYRRAGSFGVFGRIAEGRMCELDGKCLTDTATVLRTFDVSGLPEPLKAETLMRAARAEAYQGRLPSAVHIIARQIKNKGTGSICREGGELLCRRILLEAMRTAGETLPKPGGPRAPDARTAIAGVSAGSHGGAGHGPAQGAGVGGGAKLDPGEREYLEEVMEAYLTMPSWETGPLAVELVQAAAPLAAALGATAFAGNMLSTLAPEVPDAHLSEHLLLAAETFLNGQNWARARIVAEYAQTRLGPKQMKNPRWAAVLLQLNGRADEDELSPAMRAAIESELALTLTDLKNARVVLDRARSILGGTRDAAKSSDANKAREAKPGDAKSGDAKSGDAKSGDAKKPGNATHSSSAPKPSDANKRLGGAALPASTHTGAKQ
jgi:hypothetical protein